MNTSRRHFLKSVGLGIGSLSVFGLTAKNAQAELKKKLTKIKDLPPTEIAQDEDF